MDVRKLMSQLERSEKARGESEARAGDYLKSLNDLKEASEKHTSIRDKLQVRGVSPGRSQITPGWPFSSSGWSLSAPG